MSSCHQRGFDKGQCRTNRIGVPSNGRTTTLRWGPVKCAPPSLSAHVHVGESDRGFNCGSFALASKFKGEGWGGVCGSRQILARKDVGKRREGGGGGWDGKEGDDRKRFGPILCTAATLLCRRCTLQLQELPKCPRHTHAQLPGADSRSESRV